MIVPSIDLMNGDAVQLRRGRELVINAGDPRPIADRFGRVGTIAVIDLDAALGRGEQRGTIRELCARARCRVGGGIRDLATARAILDAGAESIIIGTRADPEFLRELPRERTWAALDVDGEEIVVEGWTKGSGARLEERIRAIAPLVAGILVTFVADEGSMNGLPIERAREIRRMLPPECRLVVAGGTAEIDEIVRLDRDGIDVQVGMALYSGRFELATVMRALAGGATATDLLPTIVADEQGTALGFCFSSERSLRASIESGEGTYESRRRGLWRKGASSGATQRVRRIELDCDRDCVRITVEQDGAGFCHERTRTCFGDDPGLGGFERRLGRAARNGGYTQKLVDEPAFGRGKLIEEAIELAEASEARAESRTAAASSTTRARVVEEAADLLYMTTALLSANDVTWSEVLDELDRRARRVSRRPGALTIDSAARDRILQTAKEER